MSIISRILGDFEYLPDETFFDKLTGDEIETGAVNTGELGVGGHVNILGIESREITLDTGPAASDGTWDTESDNVESKTFATAFASSPAVTLTPDSGLSFRGVVSVENISTTGFDARHRNFSTFAQLTGRSAYYTAVDQ